MKDASVMPNKEELCAQLDNKIPYVSDLLSAVAAQLSFKGEKKKKSDGSILCLAEKQPDPIITIMTNNNRGIGQMQCVEQFCVRVLTQTIKYPKWSEDGSILLNPGSTWIEKEIKIVRGFYASIFTTCSHNNMRIGQMHEVTAKYSDVLSEIGAQIIKFAASTRGDLYVLSQTCKQWNDILNKIPNTANPIWKGIARRFYDNDQDFRHLDNIGGTQLGRQLMSTHSHVLALTARTSSGFQSEMTSA